MGGEIAALGPNVVRHSVFSGPQKYSGNSSILIFLQPLTVNISAEALN